MTQVTGPLHPCERLLQLRILLILAAITGVSKELEESFCLFLSLTHMVFLCVPNCQCNVTQEPRFGLLWSQICILIIPDVTLNRYFL